MSENPDGHLCFIAQLAGGQTCMGTDRDGEGYVKILLSAADLARVVARMHELESGFYVTLVPEADAKRPPSKRPAH